MRLLRRSNPQHPTPASPPPHHHHHSFPRMLGLTEHYDDLEDLTAEKRNDNLALRTQACWKVGWRISGKLTVF